MYRINGNIIFNTKPVISSYASVAGKKEGEGPLKESFDRVINDSHAGKETFEQAESELMKLAVRTAIQKRGVDESEIDVAFGGDLLNQCVASSFAMRRFGIPYVGIYGACSTMGLGLIMASSTVEGGSARRAICAASSHFCTAERQYRTPLEYGSQRPPTAQWTVTASGACIVESTDNGCFFESKTMKSRSISSYYPYVHAARVGKITDYSVTDQNNMGAAMAPANVKLGTK